MGKLILYYYLLLRDMFQKIIPFIIACFIVVGCNSGTMEKSTRLDSFFAKDYIPIDKYKEPADSVFNCQYILGQEGEFYVYVFDGGCSSCIMETLDFIESIQTFKNRSIPEILFFNKTDNNDIFVFYYNKVLAAKLRMDAPYCYQMYDRSDLLNGLYFIENGLIKGYLPWHYQEIR